MVKARRAAPRKLGCRTGVEQIRLCTWNSRSRSGEGGCSECRRELDFRGPERSGAPWAAHAGLRGLQRGPRDAICVFLEVEIGSRFQFGGWNRFQVPVFTFQVSGFRFPVSSFSSFRSQVSGFRFQVFFPRGVAPPWVAAGSYPPRDGIRQRTDDGREITDAKRQRTYPITDKRCVGEPRFISHHGREQIDAEEGNGSGGRSPPWSLVYPIRG